MLRNNYVLILSLGGNNATLSIEKCQELEKVLKPLCFHLSGTTIELYYHPTPNMPIMIGTVSLDTAKNTSFCSMSLD